MIDYEARCQALGIEFFEVPPPIASYTYAVEDEKHVYLSGHGPFEGADGIQRYRGKVGRDISPIEAREVARFTVIGCLSTLRQNLGSLNRVLRIVRVTGYVNADPECDDYYKAVDGASDLLVDVFGDAGHHARMSIGCSVTPRQVPVAIDMIVRVHD
jgi:enamine deaminase RidA (YjgF/YER057c/UK114 family)